VANEDKATRYHRLHRRASLASTALSALLFLVLLITGWSATLRNSATSIAGPSFIVVVVLYVLLVALLSEVVQLPLAFYRGVTLERRYGLSTQTTARWWRDHYKAGAISLLFGIGAALVVWSLLRWSPDRWWIIAAACFSVILVVFAQLTPVLLLPLFYESKPLDRPSLVSRLVALAERAGAHVLGVFELRVSDKTRKANAALAGVGRTRRILLSDTLLAEHSDDEIEVILAHELAHHVHRDIVKAIVLETALITLGFYLSDRVLESLSTRFALMGKSDIAALPLLVLTFGAVSLVLLPFANALSRAHERRADRYALAITGRPAAFVSAMRRLATQNLVEAAPSAATVWFFHTHPPIEERIQAARAFE
jgi:STE24 endopeptidase